MQMFSQHIESANISNTKPVDQHTGICFSGYAVTYKLSSNKWIVDTDASRHIGCNLESFSHIEPINDMNFVLPNHTHVKSEIHEQHFSILGYCSSQSPVYTRIQIQPILC